jgi:ubiquinone/menaquinone biosynthesis C-methylase UbiE
MTKEQNGGDWDQIYQAPEGYQYYDLSKPHQEIPRLARLFQSNGVRDVLDLGCGTGSNLLALAKSGFSLTGIDQSVKGLTIAKQKVLETGLTANINQARFQELPFGDRRFDAVISIQTLNHGYEEDVRQGIAEIERVLKPKGLVFVTVPGRIANGKVRYCLVKTAERVAYRVYIPRKGGETGIPHFIYNKAVLREHFRHFTQIGIWRDDRDYYCFLGEKSV